ncbi:MAG: archaetidylserine decarboxylase [Gemmatimonadota bacterium]
MLQHLLPKQALTTLAGRVAAAHGGAMTTALIRWFVDQYGVNMREAAEPDVAKYQTFNDFFTRALKPGARPISNGDLVCPVDGAISQCGEIEADQILQAKGHQYSVRALLGGDADLAADYVDGSFATIYLSPKDYHRIHMPCDGRLLRMTHVPGDLFSVNPATARSVPGLFARNERVICLFETDTGPFVMILVGATIVGSMATTWHGVVNAERPGTVRSWQYDDQEIRLAKGDEMGRFQLGSTVVMLFRSNYIMFDRKWKADLKVRMGEPMGIRYPTTGETRIS